MMRTFLQFLLTFAWFGVQSLLPLPGSESNETAVEAWEAIVALRVWDCVTRVLREEGSGAFYASYRATVIMNTPFTAMHFNTYEAAERGLMEISPESASNERPLVHTTTGVAAVALAAVLTTPLDVVKTQLQRQMKGLDVDSLYISHIRVNHAQK